ncbi:MAG: GNAT family N-acetyltransferase [Candidatus Riflebacteria bacterium]|nr:GNAT family N-acetyltransferase [Candidatus Riflebacteria bacterium]
MNDDSTVTRDNNDTVTLVPAKTEEIAAIWRQRWGLPICTLRRRYLPEQVEGFLLTRGDLTQGLVTWAREGPDAELVTIDAFRKRQGDGTRMLAAVEERLQGAGARRVVLSTTNDNQRAVGFYLRRGYRVVRVALDAMREVRRLKPQIPERGQSGLPIQDMWELEKPLAEWSRPPRHILTILAVAELARSATFYRDAFGFPARVDVPVYVELELPDGRGLGLYAASAFACNTGEPPAAAPPGITATELYFHCDDLDASIRKLREAGARLLSGRARRPWGDEAAYFADPDGNVLVVAQPAA